MSPNNTGVINLHVDVGDTTTKVADLGKTFAGLGNEVNAVGASITDALHSVALSLEEIESGIQSINNLLLEAAASVSNVAAHRQKTGKMGGGILPQKQTPRRPEKTLHPRRTGRTRTPEKAFGRLKPCNYTPDSL